MASFWYLWEAIEKQPQVQDGSEEDDSKAVRIVRTGMGLSEPGSGRDFWDDFVSVCGDAEGLADLLGVSKDVVAQWPSKVQEAKSKIDSSDDEESKTAKRELLPTGEPDFATPTTDTPDTRPMP